MNSKEILSYLRNGDFAHPGEIEAIELAMKPIIKNPKQWMLDIGSGLGGTAHYLQEHEWGRVVGVDIDPELISYAKRHYPEMLFFHSDALEVEKCLPEIKFQAIYLFSSFFCFPRQKECLRRLSNVADEQCELMLFDYSRLHNRVVESPFDWSQTAIQFNPIYLPEFKPMLADTGWEFKESINITSQFKHWYSNLLHQFAEKQRLITDSNDLALYQAMFKGYQRLFEEMEAGNVGGIIVYAKRKKIGASMQ